MRNGIFGVGGWKEALGGLRHKTIPTLIGFGSSLTLSGLTALALRFLLIVAAALYPILLKKIIVTPQPLPSTTSSTFTDGVSTLIHTFVNPTPIDFLLGVLGLTLVGTPKFLEMWARRSKIEQHSPYYELAAAIREMPPNDAFPDNAADAAIKLTLSGLRDEMSQLIGDDPQRRVTDVTLLEFCNSEGTQMEVRARTANHEPVKRPKASERFVAYFVALEGRSFAEHDFTSTNNPFPASRVSVIGSPRVNYRSVLYMPVIWSEREKMPEGKHGAFQVIDNVVGVICVHSAKPYRFWRWGDQRKGVGGFADIAFERSMPYIALIERLLAPNAPLVRLEIK